MKVGFTLIELLVVVLIIGILAAIALPQYQLAVARSRVASLLPLMKGIQQAQQLYYLEHGQYVDNFNQLDIEFPAGAELVSSLKIVYNGFSCESSYNGGMHNSLYCAPASQGLSLEQYYAADYMICWFWTNKKGRQICSHICHQDLKEDANRCSF